MDLRDLFPHGPEPPEFSKTLLGGAWWLVYLVFLPGLLNMFGGIILSSESGYLLGDFLYLGLSALVLFLIFRSYLTEMLDNFKWEWKNCLKTAAVGLGLMVLLTVPLAIFLLGGFAPVADAWNQFPIWALISSAPVVTLFLNVLLAPFVMGLLYRVTVFGSICDSKPWLAYVAVAVVSIVPLLLPARNGFLTYSVLTHWVYALPVHLVSCWVYQKSGTVISSMLAHSGFNLLSWLFLLCVTRLFV